MKRIVVANWKENPLTLDDAKYTVQGIRTTVRKALHVEVVLAPPVVFIPELTKWCKKPGFFWGAQTVSHEKQGPYTGEISTDMLKPYGVTHILIGHSERRALGETSEVVAVKVLRTVRAGMKAVLCIGERERRADGAYMHEVRDQLLSALSPLTERELSRLFIAYEPLWTIGKLAEEAITPDALLEMTLYIKKLITEKYSRKAARKVQVLYGGAVKADNAARFIKEGGVEGLLVGSASLTPMEFSAIINNVNNL